MDPATITLILSALVTLSDTIESHVRAGGGDIPDDLIRQRAEIRRALAAQAQDEATGD